MRTVPVTFEIARLPKPDAYGRRSIEGAATQLNDRRIRRWQQASATFIHRVPNGVYDPFSFFHLVDELSNLEPNRPFTAADLARWLNVQRPAFIWDAVTIGRMLNDLRDSFAEGLPGDDAQPLTSSRTWAGTRYSLGHGPLARARLYSLLDDLVALGTELHAAEARAGRQPRLTSPLASCPSLTARLRADRV